MTPTATAPAPSVEAATAESVRRNALYRAHVEHCRSAYYGNACLNCTAYDRAAEVADHRLAHARAAAGEGRRS